MIKKYTIFLSLLNVIFGQISMSDINKLSNDQLDLIKQELQGEPVSQNDNIDKSISVIPETVTIESPTPSSGSKYFGYNYFKRDINFFDNVPTPPDFKLGPGDEIILSLWGETNSRENLILNKEGLRFKDEFVRHKILDFIGDLYLAGCPVQGYFSGKKSGHYLNNLLLRKFLSDKSNFEII